MRKKSNSVDPVVWSLKHVLLLFSIWFFSAVVASAVATGPMPIVIGLDADLSSASAQAGQSFRRGALTAIDEINAAGGVLGHPLALETRDHRGNPLRAKDNMAELAEISDLVAVLGGLYTPAALEVLDRPQHPMSLKGNIHL